MLFAWYLPTLGFSLWPCVALLVLFVPVTIWHEVAWRRTVREYARLREEAGAADGDWPRWDVRVLLGTQPWLVLLAAALLSAMLLVALYGLVMWPKRPLGFEMAVNYYDLPYGWSMVVAGLAALAAAVALALEAARSPWAPVARTIRHAVHAPHALREQLFARALVVDPGVPIAERLERAEQLDERR